MDKLPLSYWKATLHVGTVFNTPFESNCVVTSEIDTEGNFLAKDSEGVECEFSTEMISFIHI